MQFFKRLEIHGFKSFAHKTVIDFLPGVTVVVGPNGCGKSNVFDAIRWVLGESRVKSLRGDRMDDVIFGGTDLAKATGFARVDLVLNNERSFVPIDFAEFSVGRSLFRTGESEYRLNNNICRRKDITGLFLDTGVGTDGYSVMEQGRISQIINAKPSDRRAIFDEAAGIARYK
ncbi:MAG: AAA family ATPase, partial [Candidatus Sumerlaeales bacterium]|nr:AAA family ATPase [Candidatus Sumerlaeales bacterium]